MELQLRRVPAGLGRRSARARRAPRRASLSRPTASAGPCSTPRPICARKSRRPKRCIRSGLRGSPIEAVVLTGAEIDQTAGLLSLRERSPFTLMATAATLAAVADNPMFGVLAPDVVSRRAITPGEHFALGGGLASRAVHGARQGAALSRRRQSGHRGGKRGQCRRRNLRWQQARWPTCPARPR